MGEPPNRYRSSAREIWQSLINTARSLRKGGVNADPKDELTILGRCTSALLPSSRAFTCQENSVEPAFIWTTNFPSQRQKSPTQHQPRLELSTRSTTHIHSAMAAQAVFSVAELFDAIMLYVDPIQLFVSERVCIEWRNFLRNSTVLRRRMFLREGAMAAATDPSQVNLNPCIADVLRLVNTSISPDDRESSRIKVWAKPNASWRKMLLIYPPLKGQRLSLRVQPAIGTSYSMRSWHSSGVPPGTVVDSISDNDFLRSMSLQGLLNTLERMVRAEGKSRRYSQGFTGFTLHRTEDVDRSWEHTIMHSEEVKKGRCFD